MARPALLNNVDHKELRVLLRYGDEFGDNSASVTTFPTEFADMQKEYPIFFRKDPANGEYQAIALLGFERGENLFVSEGRWNAFYMPGMVARGPFMIGVPERQNEGDARADRLIHVDLDHPRISFTEGEPVFMPQGGNTPLLDHVAAILRGIHEGMQIGKAMFAAFAEADLIEPVTLNVKVTSEQTYNLSGLHSISMEKLRGLKQEPVFKLHQAGWLFAAFLVASSVGNVKKLIAMKQAKLRGTQTPTNPTLTNPPLTNPPLTN